MIYYQRVNRNQKLFQSNGYLREGIHKLSIMRFGKLFGEINPYRTMLMQRVESFFNLLRESGVKRIYINGSFTTQKEMPSDIDYIVELPEDFDYDSRCSVIIGNPSLSMQQFNADILSYKIGDKALRQRHLSIFTGDRDGTKKGITEVQL